MHSIQLVLHYYFCVTTVTLVKMEMSYLKFYYSFFIWFDAKFANMSKEKIIFSDPKKDIVSDYITCHNNASMIKYHSKE